MRNKGFEVLEIKILFEISFDLISCLISYKSISYIFQWLYISLRGILSFLKINVNEPIEPHLQIGHIYSEHEFWVKVYIFYTT